MDEDEEMESGTVQLYNIRTIKQRNDFLVQTKVSSYVVGTPSSGATYDIHDARAKERNLDDGRDGSSTLEYSK